MSTGNNKAIAYVGCYTKPRQADPFLDQGGVPYDESKVGQGVLAVSIDTTTGQMQILNQGRPVIPNIVNPSYLCLLPDASQARFLGVVSEVEPEGNVSLYEIQDKTTLQHVTTLPTHGSHPCHITPVQLSGPSPHVFVANYGNTEGIVSSYRLENGSLAHHATLSHGPNGSKANLARQQSTHAHCCVDGPENRVFVVDLGADAIVQYQINDEDQLMEMSRLALPPGSGPRSMVLHPTSPEIGAVSLEMDAKIQLIRQNNQSLETVGAPLSILPPNWPTDANTLRFNSGKWASDTVWSSNGKFLLAAARLHNSISVFDYQDGSLTFRHRVSTGGQTPRCLTVYKDLLLVCHQHSHDVTSFRIHPDTGLLNFADKIEVPLASCIKVVEDSSSN